MPDSSVSAVFVAPSHKNVLNLRSRLKEKKKTYMEDRQRQTVLPVELHAIISLWGAKTVIAINYGYKIEQLQ